MSEVQVDKGLFVNPNKTHTVTRTRVDEEGNYVEVEVEEFGVEEIGWRDPNTHAVVFADSEVPEAPQPEVPVEPERVTVESEDSTAVASEADDSQA